MPRLASGSFTHRRVRYLDWAQEVVRTVVRDRPAYTLLTIPKLAAELGLPLEGLADAEQNEVSLAISRVISDLASHGFLVLSSGGHSIDHPAAARRFRLEPLSSTWHELRSGYLEAEDEAFLSALAGLSEQPGERLADVADVLLTEVFTALGWDWDLHRALAVYNHLRDGQFVEGRMYLDGEGNKVRITYAGLVRTLDDTGGLLREAEEHLQAHRLRAAGCIAAVELERRLKEIVGRPANVSRKRDPSLEDYNQTAFDAGLIDQETWRAISGLAAIRKRCVHVMDSEPEADEVGRLLAGVERILRRYPNPY